MSRFEKGNLVVERLPDMTVRVTLADAEKGETLASWEWSECVNRVALRPFGGRSVDCGPIDATGSPVDVSEPPLSQSDA